MTEHSATDCHRLYIQKIYMILTCAHSGSVRVPPPICSTHCPHPPSWNKPWVTSEEYLSTISCVFIWFNGTIHRRSGITTVDWRAKLKPHDTYQVVLGIHSVPALQYRCRGWSVVIAQWSQHWWLKLEAMHGFNFWWLLAFIFLNVFKLSTIWTWGLYPRLRALYTLPWPPLQLLKVAVLSLEKVWQPHHV